MGVVVVGLEYTGTDTDHGIGAGAGIDNEMGGCEMIGSGE